MAISALFELVRLAYLLVEGGNVDHGVTEPGDNEEAIPGTTNSLINTDTNDTTKEAALVAEDATPVPDGSLLPIHEADKIPSVAQHKSYIKAANYDTLKALEESRKIVWGDRHQILAKLPPIHLQYYENAPSVDSGTEPGQLALVCHQPLVRWKVNAPPPAAEGLAQAQTAVILYQPRLRYYEDEMDADSDAESGQLAVVPYQALVRSKVKTPADASPAADGLAQTQMALVLHQSRVRRYEDELDADSEAESGQLAVVLYQPLAQKIDILTDVSSEPQPAEMALVLYQPLVHWPAQSQDQGLAVVDSPTPSSVVTKEEAQISDVPAVSPESAPEESELAVSRVVIEAAPVEVSVAGPVEDEVPIAATASASKQVATPIETVTVAIPAITDQPEGKVVDIIAGTVEDVGPAKTPSKTADVTARVGQPPRLNKRFLSNLVLNQKMSNNRKTPSGPSPAPNKKYSSSGSGAKSTGSANPKRSVPSTPRTPTTPTPATRGGRARTSGKRPLSGGVRLGPVLANDDGDKENASVNSPATPSLPSRRSRKRADAAAAAAAAALASGN